MAEDAPKPLPKPPAIPPRNRSKILRFLGINVKTLLEFAPSRKTSMYLTLAASPVALYLYDRKCAEEVLTEYKKRVAHMAEAPMPAQDEADEDALLKWPRKIWIMSTRVPDDFEEDRGNRWFKTYIKPILHAAGYDYSFLNGTAPGALGRRIRDQIRLERIANMAPEAMPKLAPGSAGYLESLDKRRHAKAMGLTVLVGRNTMKEYFWGFKQGWLVDFDAIQEERGDEGKLQDLREELDKDGVFDVPLQAAVEADEPLDAPESQPSSSIPQNAPSSLFAPRSSYSFLSQKPSAPEAMPDIPETRSLIVLAATEIPAQPPVLILPFDHPLGYLRHWPVKMVKYLFFERYRVRQGCEAALAIINATHPDDSLSHLNTLDGGESRRGLRPLQAPRRLEDVMQHEETATIDEVVTENKKKVRSEWQGEDIPDSDSKDLDTDYYAEYHYRKSFTDTPTNIISGKKVFYDELPEKLRIARELENRDRLPTKEEQKYPPPTEDTLRKERLNKEKKWRNDFQGWLMTRVGSKVTWDPRFETFKVLDLDLAKEAIRKHGLAGERSDAINSEFV